jgi:hypothetical protein
MRTHTHIEHRGQTQPNNGVNPTAGGASFLPYGKCRGGRSVDGVGPPAAGYTER